MFQEAPHTNWDLTQMNPGPSIVVEIYILFLLLVCIVTSVELFKAWRVAPPFKLPRQANNPSYLKMLEASSTRLRQWILCTFLMVGVLTSINLTHICTFLLSEKAIRSDVILYIVRGYGANLTMAFLVVLFAFLARWHSLARIERLRG